MDLKNVGPYASVLDIEHTPRRFTYRRGFGNVVSTVLLADKVETKATPYNRLQPCSGEFGKHLPVTADPVFKMLNPQTKIAWDNTQPVPATSYQNAGLVKLPATDSTQYN
jgi:hypothetical protein